VPGRARTVAIRQVLVRAQAEGGVERASARCCSATAKAPGHDGLRYACPEMRRQPMAPALQRV